LATSIIPGSLCNKTRWCKKKNLTNTHLKEFDIGNCHHRNFRPSALLKTTQVLTFGPNKPNRIDSLGTGYKTFNLISLQTGVYKGTPGKDRLRMNCFTYLLYSFLVDPLQLNHDLQVRTCRCFWKHEGADLAASPSVHTSLS
jgi:hypothetical protein